MNFQVYGKLSGLTFEQLVHVRKLFNSFCFNSNLLSFNIRHKKKITLSFFKLYDKELNTKEIN